MAKNTVASWDTIAANNTNIGNISILGTAAASNFDNAFREGMAQIAAQFGKINYKGADLASASTVDLSTATGNAVDITGTTTITGLGTVAAGQVFVLQFDGALTLTHNATSLKLPGGRNITTAAGDIAVVVSEGSGNWRCVSYSPSGGYNLELIQVQTASNSATLDFETGFDGIYRELLFVLTGIVPATDGATLYTRMKLLGSYATTSYQYHMTNQTATSTSYSSVASSSAAFIQISSGAGNGVAESVDGEMRVTNVNSSLFKRVFSDMVTVGTSANLIVNRSMGIYSGGTTALQGIRFYMSSGDIGSGTIALYGIR